MTEKIFLTIRQVAKTGLISENALRRLVKEDKAPFIKSGNRYLINYPLLKEQLFNLNSIEGEKIDNAV